ncbi:hypothetical protein R69927_00789 [Paraburkholderia domus]|jgi:hypothetical protein|uniref:Uncharacterized protein n=1 Tax=Paraburkholderia domus TaxID=2793075 RepID=A0A9N8MLZ5_9BURK|nr:hypothetical protein R70006_02516 [Paraburkholderia domus]CAE6774103.1 hypothetical protein R69749_01381 [Paraburkholderia domus]CAE6824109.1 hypothetical protein R69927_00789 [Paraburkholderia domus]CAE6858156.1 hypothetical protein R70199_00713 [Paraburkholderia domus]CAE6869016.1 hypothetical protein R70211_01057 [Paraburkholderia domus]
MPPPYEGRSRRKFSQVNNDISVPVEQWDFGPIPCQHSRRIDGADVNLLQQSVRDPPMAFRIIDGDRRSFYVEPDDDADCSLRCLSVKPTVSPMKRSSHCTRDGGDADARTAGLLAMSAERVGVTRTVAVAMPPCKTKVQLSHGTRVVRCTCTPVMRLRYVGAGATAIRNTRCNRPAAGIEAPCTEWPRVTHSSNLRVRRSNYFVLLQADQDPFGTSGTLCTRKTYWPAPESLVRSTLSRCSWRAAFDEVIPALCDLIWSG